MDSKSISIVIPAYNAEKYLRDCIESIGPQLHASDEIIVVDDGSKDGTGAICNEFIRQGINLKYIKKTNGGVSSARNRGIDEASNMWIMFIDADDLLHPQALSNLRTAIHENDDMVVGGFTSSKNWGRRDASVYQLDKASVIKLLLCYPANMDIVQEKDRFEGMGLWPCWGKLFSRRLLNEKNIRFDPNLFLGEDLIFNLEYLINTDAACFVNSELYYYRPNEQSVTARFQSKRIINTNYLAERIKKCLEETKSFDIYKKDYCRFVIIRAIACYQLYFAHVDNKKSEMDIYHEFKAFMSEPTIKAAIHNAPINRLSSGKKQRYKYALIAALLKAGQFRLLLKLKRVLR